jgi:TRAP-type C4-dicarboxylate transport system substrate-binding protein
MIDHRIRRGVLVAGALATMLSAGAAKAELDNVNFEVIVGNHTDPWTTQIIVPFFNEKLKELSDGKITVHTVAYTELGLSGFELMNLLELGTNDISWGVPGYLAGKSPIAEGLGLPGITGDYNVMFKVQDAYRDVFDRALQEKFNAKLIFWSQQPALQAYCNLTEEEAATFSLETMKGKKARIHSTSFADFAEAIGAVPVTMPFADVIPGLERGVIDCALTSPTAAYGYKIGQVASHVVEIRSGYTTHFFAMNLDTWNGLNAETQAFLTEQFAQVEAEARAFTPQIQEEAAKCLADGPCSLGEPAGMGYVSLSEEEEADLRARFKSS